VVVVPKVSVISIARLPTEFAPLREALSRQTFRDFEFVEEAGGTIPEAWNRAIARAQGEILVFTETDATPVNEHWLEELVNSIPDDRTIVKGLEITGAPWDLANLAAHRSVFADARFDESFLWAEDTELFCRLKRQGYKFIRVDKAPVIHRHKMGSKRALRRAFRYGVYQARLRLRYGDDGVEVAGIGDAVKRLLGSFLNLIGIVMGYLLYLPRRLFRKRA
jgi:GT2 family glycosyltransferase